MTDPVAMLEAHRLIEAPHYVDSNEEETVTLEGTVIVEGQRVTLRVILSSGFPLELPRFHLRPWDALGFIPHVMYDSGYVCYVETEGLIWDRHRPDELLLDTFSMALSVLADGVSGRNIVDFVKEFDVYWRQLVNRLPILSVLEPGPTPSKMLYGRFKDELAFFGHSEHDLSTFLNGSDLNSSLTFQSALYIPLQPGTVLVPPRADGPFWSVTEVRELLQVGLTVENRQVLQTFLDKRTRKYEYVVIDLPHPDGGSTLFGLEYRGMSKKHPLSNGGTAKQVIPLQLHRLDKTFLLPRGGGDIALSSQRILLIGCGAVGGHIAFELARTGVLNLTVVDPDTLDSQNTFRHVLGKQYWAKGKAVALKEELEAQIPYTQIRAVNRTIEVALSAKLLAFADYDLVIFAVGNPTVELAINEQLHTLPDAPPALFTWVEPLGIGGHAVLTNHDQQGGCLECLYIESNEGVRNLINRASFAAPNQSFGKALSGCGSLHTPYGSADAAQTAILAVRLAIAVLTGQEAGNPLLSWKGDASAFEKNGFALSDRYEFSNEDLHRYRYAFKNSHCPVCATRQRACND